MFINWDKVLNQPNPKRIYNIRFSLSSRNPMDPGRSARGAGHPQKAMDVDFMTLDDHGLSWIIWIINDYQWLSWIIMDYHGLSWIIMDYEQHLWEISLTDV